MYKLFLIEDDPGIAAALTTLCTSWGMELKTAQNLREPLRELAEYAPQLVLLDIMLPFFNGYHWCSELRKTSQVPIIFLSSASDNMNIIMAVNLGADDFIAKPFDGNVLMAKVQALLRRTYDFAAAAPVPEYRGAVLHPDDQSLTVHGEKLTLSKNEYRILACLMENRGKIVSRERLMERLWETDIFVDENTLSVNVNRLRKKLATAGLESFIRTRVGVGYSIGEES